MILSRGRSFIFIHIPKTGGTALALALETRAMADDEMLGDTPKALKRRHRLRDAKTRGRLWKHSTLADIEGLASREEIAQMFTFTLVRNPYDRAVSYYHWLQHQTFDHPAVALSQKLPFDGFACHPLVRKSFMNNPAHRYMQLGDKREHCSCYIRLEHFKRDAEPVFDHLGFSIELSQVNTSMRRRDWKSYYTKQSVKSISECCAVDIERFEYSFNDSPLSL